jgi:hypothetical protein
VSLTALVKIARTGWATKEKYPAGRSLAARPACGSNAQHWTNLVLPALAFLTIAARHRASAASWPDPEISPERPPVLAPAGAFKPLTMPNAPRHPAPGHVSDLRPFRDLRNYLTVIYHRDIGSPFPPAYRHVTRFSGTGKGVVPLAGNSESDDGERVT